MKIECSFFFLFEEKLYFNDGFILKKKIRCFKFDIFYRVFFYLGENVSVTVVFRKMCLF